jgi:hypothetical protein
MVDCDLDELTLSADLEILEVNVAYHLTRNAGKSWKI